MKYGKKYSPKKASTHKAGGASRYGGNRPHRGQSMKVGGNSRTGGNRASRGTSMGKK